MIEGSSCGIQRSVIPIEPHIPKGMCSGVRDRFSRSNHHALNSQTLAAATRHGCRGSESDWHQEVRVILPKAIKLWAQDAKCGTLRWPAYLAIITELQKQFGPTRQRLRRHQRFFKQLQQADSGLIGFPLSCESCDYNIHNWDNKNGANKPPWRKLVALTDRPGATGLNSRAVRTKWRRPSVAQFGKASRETVEGLAPQNRGDYRGDTCRAVYTVRFERAAYVLHAFQKKSPKGIKTAHADVELVSRRLKLASEDYEERYGKWQKQ
jgi:phage-related protein